MSPARHRLNRLLHPWTSAWVAVAHGQREYLTGTKRIPASRLRVIPNGIDPTPYRPAGARERVRDELGIPAEAPVAGILAVLRPEKDHRTFLTAARLVLDELPEARFVVVGDGPERERVRHDVPAVLTAFDVSVLCSTDVETFPLAFLEAMATGLPLIGTRVGGLPEMIAEERNGLLVGPSDPQGLAAAMRHVLTDAGRRRAWGAESRRRVEEEFGVDRMVRAYQDLFEELLARRGRRAVDGRAAVSDAATSARDSDARTPGGTAASRS